MDSSAPRIILGSSSPRRRELLCHLIPAEAIAVIPPIDTDEPSLEHHRTLEALHEGLLETVRHKSRGVRQRMEVEKSSHDVPILTADTTVIVTDEEGQSRSLGKPPDSPDWALTVRNWFEHYYAGRCHTVASAVRIECVSKSALEFIVSTQVHMIEDVADHLDWYFATEEPLGKAGGYGIQGAASVFVDRIDGSLTNVIGLPLREVKQALGELGVPLG
ncbi:Maf family protein [Calycomorphotria hydatis]|uniref:dTTP/UTP pyrophosphatase n=1 Tax=Calycomorphotria hydatis TaxID=2528027 RepID=A0A517TC34_9PLAN|nr:Maf family protein [Calycomorphotria hydatis]QDT65923.1 Maf-like protein YhdE [Calycomorphotria hydatis]